MNDTIGCYLDLDRGEIRWSKNGIDLGKAYDIPGHLRNEKFFAAVVLKVGNVLKCSLMVNAAKLKDLGIFLSKLTSFCCLPENICWVYTCLF